MKLWNKGYDVNKEIEKFTVGNDYLLDQKLVYYDCLGSIAHAKVLKKSGILNDSELKNLIEGLKEVIRLNKVRKFEIKQEDEDCHTAIENYLISRFGEAGKKIHTGRSRNDQVLTAMRLYEKEELKEIIELIDMLVDIFSEKVKKNGKIKLPGYTHMQKAMPANIEMWFSAYIEGLKESKRVVENIKFSVAGLSKSNYNLIEPIDKRISYGSSKKWKISVHSSEPLSKRIGIYVQGVEKLSKSTYKDQAFFQLDIKDPKQIPKPSPPDEPEPPVEQPPQEKKFPIFNWIISGIVAIIILGSAIFLTLKLKTVHKIKPVESKRVNASRELVDYVKKWVRRGQSWQDIYKVMSIHGYKKDEIQAAFKESYEELTHPKK